MSLLDRKNSFVWILLFIVSYGLSNFFLASQLNVYEKEAWYTKPIYWLLGCITFFPAVIMLLVFYIQISCGIAQKLNVPAGNIYTNPFVWILCLIVPIIGWCLGVVMLIYVLVWPFASLIEGNGEKYIK